MTATSATACGTGGSSCLLCSSGQACVSGACACTAASCATGCCDSNNQCASGTQATACGKSGAACKKCAATEKCAAGACTTDCTAATCIGCCQGTVCKAGSDPSACGKSGGACAICPATESCVNGSCAGPATCDATVCPAGCCEGNTCQPGTSDLACGGSGNSCKLCDWYQLCSSAACAFDPTSEWFVDLVSVKIDPASVWDTNADGSPKPPDVFVELAVGTQTKVSKTVNDSYDPVFNQYMVYESAANLMNTINIKVWDWDPTGGNDLICEWTEHFYSWEFPTGSVAIYWPDSCKYVTYIEFRVY